MRLLVSSSVACYYWCFVVVVVAWKLQSVESLASSTMTMNTNSLVVVGLNAALQKRFVISNDGNLVPGNVHRASQIQTGVGGKGQDVAIALGCLGTAGVRLLQFVGQGAEGDAVCQLLDEQLGAETIDDTTIRVQSLMRTCTSIVGSSDTTELVEPSGQIEAEEIQNLLQKCDDLKATSGICVMGSMPPGCSAPLYSEIYQRLAKATTTTDPLLCVMDSVAGVEPMFQVLTGPTIYKVNAQELCGLVGLSEASNLSETIPAFLAKYQPPAHLQAIAITDGKRPGHLCWLAGPTEWELFPLTIPKLDSSVDGTKTTLFPIGAGDAVAAGTLAAWLALQSNDTTEGSAAVPVSCREALSEKIKGFEKENVPTGASELMAAFGFGLACGSASKYYFGTSVLCCFADMTVFSRFLEYLCNAYSTVFVCL
jgi:fructose-1-phosphate kinase PfkB-like protein